LAIRFPVVCISILIRYLMLMYLQDIFHNFWIYLFILYTSDFFIFILFMPPKNRIIIFTASFILAFAITLDHVARFYGIIACKIRMHFLAKPIYFTNVTLNKHTSDICASMLAKLRACIRSANGDDCISKQREDSEG